MHLNMQALTNLTVRLFEDDGYLKLHVIDEGIGFDLNAIHPKGTGLGLYGMRERAELVEGRTTILSELGKGTSCTFGNTIV